MSSLICSIFKHTMSAPTFTDQGTWRSTCEHCTHSVTGLVPAPHSHEWLTSRKTMTAKCKTCPATRAVKRRPRAAKVET